MIVPKRGHYYWVNDDFMGDPPWRMKCTALGDGAFRLENAMVGAWYFSLAAAQSVIVCEADPPWIVRLWRKAFPLREEGKDAT